MRTSLNEIKQNEAYLFNQMEAGEALAFRAELLVNTRRRFDLGIQERLYSIIRLYGRRQLRAEIEQVHEELFHGTAHASFRQKIARIFNKP
jgi:hypothetical protein